MGKKDDRQSELTEYKLHQVGITHESYALLEAIKNQLSTKHKRPFTFSEAIMELQNRTNGATLKFTQAETAQIKTVLKGGLK